MPTGLLAQVTNQTRGALCVGNLGSRGSFMSLADIRMEALRGGFSWFEMQGRGRIRMDIFLAMAIEVKSFLRLSLVYCALSP
jgi:hypothetical protein